MHATPAEQDFTLFTLFEVELSITYSSNNLIRHFALVLLYTATGVYFLT